MKLLLSLLLLFACEPQSNIAGSWIGEGNECEGDLIEINADKTFYWKLSEDSTIHGSWMANNKLFLVMGDFKGTTESLVVGGEIKKVDEKQIIFDDLMLGPTDTVTMHSRGVIWERCR